MIRQEKIQKLLFILFIFLRGEGNKLPKFSNYLLTAEQSSGIHIGLRKVLQMCTINHRNYFVKLAKMPENNCFQKVVIKNLCGPMSSESWQEVQKGI